jgi:hypothetical protein
VQGIQLGLEIADRHGTRVCVPGTLSAEGLESAVKTRLDQTLAATPGAQQHAAASVISAIAVHAFPCQSEH